ncbi:hypothetical protein MMC12_008005 [Toensbergia leucococca]|nr:hypothetical protein [Toensbergia leucococca]
MPKIGLHLQLTEWAKQYGGIYSLKLGPVTAIVLTDRRLVKDLIDRKSLIYSDRPPSYVAHHLISGGIRVVTETYGEVWKTYRKLIHQQFMERVCDTQHIIVQNAEAVQMLRDFCISPDQHMRHPKRYSNSSTLSTVYGIRTPSLDTPHFTALCDYMDKFALIMTPGATPPVDVFPFLKMLPEGLFGNWITRCREIAEARQKLYDEQLDRAIEQKRRAGNRGSFIDRLLDVQEKDKLTRHQLQIICGGSIEAGTDSTATTLLVFMQAMTQWPHVQRKAQQEIDSVMGEDRSPLWADSPNLPYVNQVIKEAMRWRAVAPMAFPHSLQKDDHVDGMFIPKGSTIIINAWGLHYSESHFPNPDTFNPDNYFNHPLSSAHYANAADYASRDHYGFGAGRRLCPGIHLAERSLFIGISKLLWAFDFTPGLDESGEVIPIDLERTGYVEGIVVSPKPFACSIRPRSEGRRATVMREFEKAAEEVFVRYEF